jgi:excinuclease UvrABC nuclease subunit
MKFDYGDKNDKRVVEASPYALDYPAEVDKAPNNAGVYMFIDGEDEVIYVGKASGGRLRDEIKAKRNTNADKDAKKYRWFRTNSDEVAKDLEADWIKKYKPKNNRIGK